MSENEQAISHRQPLVFGDIEAMKRKGFNQSEIAEAHGVSRQAVSWHVRNYGGSKTLRQIVDEQWPWKTTHRHSRSKLYQNLRNHGEYIATGGKGMNEEKLSRLRGFYKKLRDNNIVVEFDPNLPPERGVSSVGGFAFRERLPSDGDLLIRINKHTNITEEGMDLWSFPEVEP